MPAKNKPKRLNRHRSWRVARRKKKQTELANPRKRTRTKRPKDKTTKTEVKTTQIEKKVAKKTVKKKTATKKD